MKRIMNKVIKTIKEEKGTFISSIISFILVFTLVNIYMFGVINADAYRLKSEGSNQIILYLKDMTLEEKNKVQKDILALDGVSSIRYESKDLAIKSLETELGVDLSSEANPLEDTFFIYLNRDVDIMKLSTELNKFDFVSSMDLREKVIAKTVHFSQALDTFIFYSVIFLLIFSITIIINICTLSVKVRKREIYRDILNNVSVKSLKIIFFVESLFAILISSVISFVIYSLIRTWILKLIHNTNISVSVFKEVSILFIILLISIILSYIINFYLLNKYYSLSYYEEKRKEEEQKDKEVLNSDEFEDLREEN